MNLLSSEWLKTKRTFIRWLIFCMPIVYASLIIGYIGLRGIDNNTETLVFRFFFEVWAVFFSPLGTGIISGFIVYQEELAGGFNGFLSSKLPRYKLYFGKFTILLIALIISIFIATFTLFVGLSLFFGLLINWTVFIVSTIFVIVGTIPLLGLHLWVSFAWGMGASIGISIGGLLIAALMGVTNLGDKVWQFIPWTLPIRMSILSKLYLQGISEITSSEFVLNQLVMGIVAMAIFFVVSLVGGVIWFNKWDGRKFYE